MKPKANFGIVEFEILGKTSYNNGIAKKIVNIKY